MVIVCLHYRLSLTGLASLATLSLQDVDAPN